MSTTTTSLPDLDHCGGSSFGLLARGCSLAAPEPASPETVLFVADDPELARLFLCAHTRLGRPVIVAAGPGAALFLAARGRVATVVCGAPASAIAIHGALADGAGTAVVLLSDIPPHEIPSAVVVRPRPSSPRALVDLMTTLGWEAR